MKIIDYNVFYWYFANFVHNGLTVITTLIGKLNSDCR